MTNTRRFPNEELSALQYSIIDYLHNIDGREVDKTRRIAITHTCRDADYIPKVKKAGEVISDKKNGTYQIMHNGLKVTIDGYYGPWVTDSIKSLSGHHEPQEEKVFFEVTKRLDPNAWMIELGSYWSYYSLWFHQVVKNGRNICCEPDPENIKIGKKNAALNNFDNMYFVDAAAGSENGKLISFHAEHVEELVEVPIRTVDSLVEEFNINKLELLHMDVQGFELDSLHGAIKTIQKGKLRFIFISTHHYLISRNPNIHQQCIDFIIDLGGHIICEHDIHESYSGDGLIVASFDSRDKEFTVEVSRNRMSDNQFRTYTKDLQLSFEAYEHILSRLVSQNDKVRRLENDFNELKRKNENLIKDLEHLSNLPIPQASKELVKSMERSLKFRVVKSIWGRNHFYTPTNELIEAANSDISDKQSAERLVKVIAASDAANAQTLVKLPSAARQAMYETARRVGHTPRKVLKKIKGR